MNILWVGDFLLLEISDVSRFYRAEIVRDACRLVSPYTYPIKHRVIIYFYDNNSFNNKF